MADKEMQGAEQAGVDDLARRFVAMCAGVWAGQNLDPVAFHAACLTFGLNQGVGAVGEIKFADFLEGISDALRPPPI